MIVSAVSPEVLLIDDDHMDVKAVMRAFRRAGIEHPISVVDNGVEALKALRSRTFRASTGAQGIERPLLILLDLKMPLMDGFEFLDELRADPALTSHVVFVMATSESATDRSAAYRRHVAGFLLKSEIGKSPEMFTDMVGSYLRAVQLPH